MKIGRYETMWAFVPWWRFIFPFDRDEETGEWGLCKPRLGFDYFKDKPCVTKWRFDWILKLGWLTIYKRAIK